MANDGSDHMGLDYVHPTAITAWQLIGTCLGIFVILVFAAWTIVTNEASNNRSIIDDLKNYVTKSNHEDLASRFNDFRIDTVKHLDATLPRKAFEDFLAERNKLIDGMREDIKGAVTRVEQGLSSSASKDQIAQLQAQITALREQLQRQGDRDDLKFITKEEMKAHARADVERVESIRREVDALRAEMKGEKR